MHIPSAGTPAAATLFTALERLRQVQHLVLIVLLLALASPVKAQEFYFLGGLGLETRHNDTTGAWLLEYLEGINEHFAASFSYVNQGHFPGDHRDGHAVSLWARTSLLDNRLGLAVGAGPLFYYNTTHAAYDAHGWGGVFNVAANWYTDSRFIYQLRGKYIQASDNFDTYTILAGLGYQLEAPASQGPRPSASTRTEKTTNQELTFFVGETVVNIPADRNSLATKIEYRRGVWRYVDWTAAFLYEGETALINRYGLVSQLWLAKPFLKDHITLGVGFGGYLAIDTRRHDKGYDDETFAEMVTLSSSYRFNRDWLARISWDRVITSYDRDADVFLGGIGYRF